MRRELGLKGFFNYNASMPPVSPSAIMGLVAKAGGEDIAAPAAP